MEKSKGRRQVREGRREKDREKRKKRHFPQTKNQHPLVWLSWGVLLANENTVTSVCKAPRLAVSSQTLLASGSFIISFFSLGLALLTQRRQDVCQMQG